MDRVSQAVTTALFQTLNSDPSVNVRLAALEALAPYSKDGKVREELIRSIAKQDSPLIQVALAELMGQIQEKKSVREFEKILKDEKTPQEVKNKIKESINVLI
jgi:HEAT repeat protein